MESVISIEGLTKYYGKNRGAEAVSLEVEKGDIFGFLGQNGAGKSTTIRSMLGFIKPDEGRIRILGRDAAKDHTEILANVGYMPSESSFYPGMHVADVIKFAADARSRDCSTEAQKLCDVLLLDTKKKINELSLGNRKKVSIVCAMQHKPELFIFDEPTSGLDPLIQAKFFELINGYVKEGATCFLSTHVLSEVKNYCRHVGIMKEGRLVCKGTVDGLTHSSAKRVKGTVNGESVDYLFSGNLNSLISDLSEKNVEELFIEEPSIDEIFMNYYMEGVKE